MKRRPPRERQAWQGALAAFVALAGSAALAACGLLARATPPPPVRGIVLVLSHAYAAGVDPARTPVLRRLAASGRAFESAFAVDPEPTGARALLVGAGPRSLGALFRARGAAVAVVDAPEAPLEIDADLRLALAAAGGAVRLEPWLRAQRGSFLVVVSLAAAGAAAVPAPAASSFAPALPRIAVGDLGFADRFGGSVEPPAWSLLARQRAQAFALERTIAADAELGEWLAVVDRGAPGAAVVVVGDPPVDLGAHGVVARPGLFDDTLRTTLVVAAPGLSRPGRVSRALVSTRDVAPTLLALAGMKAEPGLEGRSLLPQLADPSAEAGSEVVATVARKAGRIGRSARTARWRYTEWPDGSTELFDHDADPGENTNLAARPGQRDVVQEMSHAFDAPPPAPPAVKAPTPRAARPRNVLLIVVDDLNTQVGAYGAPVKTPAIDRLAARGVRFDRAYVPVAMCSPSRVSMLTGWRPERTGVWNNLDPPRPAGSLPLQELFSAHGVVTATVGKIYHFPEDFHWDVREEHPAQVEDEHEGVSAGGEEALFERAAGDDLDQPDGRRARRAAELVARYARRPFFVALGLVRPHRRWIAPSRYFDLYPPAAVVLSPWPADDLADVPAIAIKTKPQPLPGLPLRGREPPGLVTDPVQRRQAIAAYDACVTFADAQVARVLKALDRHDLWRDTVVVLLGDNGYHLGEHAGLLRKDTLFEEGLRVPLIVVAPGLRPAVVRAPVDLVDLYPTLVALAGLPPVAGLDGRSLEPLLAQPDGPGRGPALSYRRVQPPERAVSIRTPRARYTLWPDGSEELYDLRSRAGESLNLAARPDRAAEKAALRQRLESLVAARGAE